MTSPDTIVAEARSLIGAPYRHLGRGPFAYDCLGVLIYVVKRCALVPVDFDFTDYGQDTAQYVLERHLNTSAYLERLPAWREALPGDILLQRFHLSLPASHLQLITLRDGDALWGVHASNRAARVVEQRIAHTERCLAAYRLKEVARG
jgi:cell wall-associated NlpC family hydrolase